MTRDVLIMEIASEIVLFESSINYARAKQLAENILTQRLERYKITREINQETGEYERND